MDHLISIKTVFLTAAGAIGGFTISLLGGWDMAIQSLILVMSIDFVTGFMVAGIWQRSNKTKNGALESRAGYKGLCKKIMILFFVVIGYVVDVLMGSDAVRYAVIIWFIGNEALSIFENAGLMGVDIPPKLRKAIEVLQGSEKDEEEK